MLRLRTGNFRRRAAATSTVLMCLAVLAGCASAPVEETPAPTSLEGLPVMTSYTLDGDLTRDATDEESQAGRAAWMEALDQTPEAPAPDAAALPDPGGTTFRVVRRELGTPCAGAILPERLEVVGESGIRVTYALDTNSTSSCYLTGPGQVDELPLPTEVTGRPVVVELVRPGTENTLLHLK